jgi:hypothetical protein
MMMDWTFYQYTFYFDLVENYKTFANVITKKLIQLEKEGLKPEDGMLYGSSMGGRFVLEGAAMFGKKQIKEIYGTSTVYKI